MNKILLGLGVLISSILMASASAAARDELATTQKLLSDGVRELALARIERLQPAYAQADWLEWELLRWDALRLARRGDDIARRAEHLPFEQLPPARVTPIALLAAQSAFNTHRYTQARRYAAHALWSGQATTIASKEARLIVIESLLADKQGQAAYRAMLRYQQDYAPLPKTQAVRFVDGLLELGADQEALSWLDQLDPNQPLRLLLEVRLGQLPPVEALERWQNSKQKLDSHGLRLMRHLADELKHDELRLWVAERSVQLNRPEANVEHLWNGYLAYAVSLGNREKLLIGDDAGWQAVADRLNATAAIEARCLYAYLALNAGQEQQREQAALSLLAILQRDGLDELALQLFGRQTKLLLQRFDIFRYELGRLAEQKKRWVQTDELWRDLTPIQETPALWRLRQARAARESGNDERGAAAWRQAVAAYLQGDPLTGDDWQLLLEIGRSLSEGKGQQSLLPSWQALATRLPSGGERNYWLYLAALLQREQHYDRAAEAWLFAAQAGRSDDDLSRYARLQAQAALRLAGWYGDASRLTTLRPAAPAKPAVAPLPASKLDAGKPQVTPSRAAPGKAGGKTL